MTKAPLTPILISALSIGAFLLVMNFAILPDTQTKNDNANTTIQLNANADATVLANTNASADDTNASINQNTNTTPDPTAGWKTYTAPTADYSFKYPDGLGNVEIEGLGYLGPLEGVKAQEWETNLLVVDKDKTSLVIYFYTPPADQVSLENSISADAWTDPKLYTKSSETINGIAFDTYTAIGEPYNYVQKGYAVTHAGRHYIIKLMIGKLSVAQEIASTFTFTN